MRNWLLPALCSVSLAACADTRTDATSLGSASRESGLVAAARLRDHVTLLSADSLVGRAPGTPGEDVAVAYIAEQFSREGLCPAFAGSWFQSVPMVEETPRSWNLSVRDAQGRAMTFDPGDVVLYSRDRAPRLEFADSETVFVGYGISAPKLGRDDYAGADVRGRTLIMMAGTPDAAPFKGVAQYRYGFGPNKAVEAARRGAEAVLIVTADGEPWLEAASAGRERRLSLDLSNAVNEPAPTSIAEGRVKRSAIERLLSGAHPLGELEAAAVNPGFRAVPLGLVASGHVEMDIRRFASRNVAAFLPGTERPQEHVVFVAHWDGLGRCAPDANGDDICNGAIDNASGVASLLELARVFKAGGRPRRSVLFLATTGEESGLLGSNYYVKHPALPLADAVGGATLDMTAGRARGTDVVLFGGGLSDIDAVFAHAAASQGRRIVPPRPDEASYFERSDNILFVREGVPVLTPSGLWAEGPGRQDFDRYYSASYHRPSDEVGRIVDFEGAAEDADFLQLFGRSLADSDEWPAWRPQAAISRPPHPAASNVTSIHNLAKDNPCGVQ